MKKPSYLTNEVTDEDIDALRALVHRNGIGELLRLLAVDAGTGAGEEIPEAIAKVCRDSNRAIAAVAGEVRAAEVRTWIDYAALHALAYPEEEDRGDAGPDQDVMLGHWHAAGGGTRARGHVCRDGCLHLEDDTVFQRRAALDVDGFEGWIETTRSRAPRTAYTSAATLAPAPIAREAIADEDAAQLANLRAELVAGGARLKRGDASVMGLSGRDRALIIRAIDALTGGTR